MRNTTGNVLAMLAVAVIATAGCNKKEANVPAADSTTMRPAQAVQVNSVDVGRSVGADMRVTGSGTEFASRDTIYASVATSGTGPATLVARWSFEDGQVVDSTSRSISPMSDAVTEFHITKPSAWPKGKYRVEVMLNGQVAGSQEFTIK